MSVCFVCVSVSHMLLLSINQSTGTLDYSLLSNAYYFRCLFLSLLVCATHSLSSLPFSRSFLLSLSYTSALLLFNNYFYYYHLSTAFFVYSFVAWTSS